MAKRKRPASAGQRGPLAGSDHETLRPADARRVRAMVEYMAKRGVGEYAAANAVLRDFLPLGELEDGNGRPDQASVVRKLVRAYQRFSYAADMPRYRLHHAINEALKRSDMTNARTLVSRLPPEREA